MFSRVIPFSSCHLNLAAQSIGSIYPSRGAWASTTCEYFGLRQESQSGSYREKRSAPDNFGSLGVFGVRVGVGRLDLHSNGLLTLSNQVKGYPCLSGISGSGRSDSLVLVKGKTNRLYSPCVWTHVLGSLAALPDQVYPSVMV